MLCLLSIFASTPIMHAKEVGQLFLGKLLALNEMRLSCLKHWQLVHSKMPTAERERENITDSIYVHSRTSSFFARTSAL